MQEVSPPFLLPTQHAVGMHVGWRKVATGCSPHPGLGKRRREAADLSSASAPCAWSSLATRKFLVPSKLRTWAKAPCQRFSSTVATRQCMHTREGLTSVLEGRRCVVASEPHSQGRTILISKEYRDINMMIDDADRVLEHSISP